MQRMNECLTTPQHEKQIGYWVSEKGEYFNAVRHLRMYVLADL